MEQDLNQDDFIRKVDKERIMVLWREICYILDGCSDCAANSDRDSVMYHLRSSARDFNLYLNLLKTRN